MTDRVDSFYTALADHYHLIFEDWNRSIDRQAAVLGPLLEGEVGKPPLRILDCTCGIGTQSLGLAKMGHRVVASDRNTALVERARKEAKARSLDIAFYVSDITSLREVYEGDFDVIAAIDNALPHLSAEKLAVALRAIFAKLKPGGVFVASIRDYDAAWLQKPKALEPAFYGKGPHRRIVHQVWDWNDEDNYTLHLYLTAQNEKGWDTHHFVSEYRCLLRDELSTALVNAGFAGSSWLMPAETGFFQPLAMAKKSSLTP